MNTSNKSSSDLSKMVVIYGDDIGKQDILLGRGTGPNGRCSDVIDIKRMKLSSYKLHELFMANDTLEHIGNIRFRNEVRKAQSLYDPYNQSSDQKKELARKVVATIKSSGGRFLRRLDDATFWLNSSPPLPEQIFQSNGSALHDLYVEVSDKVAIEKAKQCFRHQRRSLCNRNKLHPLLPKSNWNSKTKTSHPDNSLRILNPANDATMNFTNELPFDYDVHYRSNQIRNDRIKSHLKSEEIVLSSKVLGGRLLQREKRKCNEWSARLQDGSNIPQEQSVLPPLLQRLQEEVSLPQAMKSVVNDGCITLSGRGHSSPDTATALLYTNTLDRGSLILGERMQSAVILPGQILPSSWLQQR